MRDCSQTGVGSAAQVWRNRLGLELELTTGLAELSEAPIRSGSINATPDEQSP